MRGPGRQGGSAQRGRDEKALFDAIAKLKTGAEAARFFRDLATPAEIGAFAERWRIARMLNTGDRSYRDIAAQTGASTTTVARVARFLHDGGHKGYRILLDRGRR